MQGALGSSSPREGGLLLEEAFRDARKNRSDRELLYLKRYLLSLLNEPDLSKIDHSHWRHKPGVKDP
jgi:hypothetical protein